MGRLLEELINSRALRVKFRPFQRLGCHAQKSSLSGHVK